jgi:hypothetical protein
MAVQKGTTNRERKLRDGGGEKRREEERGGERRREKRRGRERKSEAEKSLYRDRERQEREGEGCKLKWFSLQATVEFQRPDLREYMQHMNDSGLISLNPPRNFFSCKHYKKKAYNSCNSNNNIIIFFQSQKYQK